MTQEGIISIISNRAFTHSSIAPVIIPDHIPESSVLSPALPCIHRAGILHGPYISAQAYIYPVEKKR